MIANQASLFLIFTMVGLIIGVLFDIFRVLRKIFKTNDLITNIEDISFWVLTGLIIIYAMYRFCDGQLRFFMIIGITIGTIMYMVTLSKSVINISLFLITKIIIYPIKIVKRLIFKPIVFICINLRKKIVKKDKKHRGFFMKKEKYNSI